MKKPSLLICGVASLLPVLPAAAAVSYVTSGSTYLQSFDSLSSNTGQTPAWVNGTTLEGWHWVNNAGAGPTTYRPADGTLARQGVILSMGKAGVGIVEDRAFGSQSPNGGASTLRFGLQLLNTTSETLSTFSLSYTGEAWRLITAENVTADSLTFSYQIFAAGTGSLTASTGWTSISSLDFIAPTTPEGGESQGVDGNDPAYRKALSGTVSGITWEDGQELWLRWTDAPGPRTMMGVDDLVFVASVPEPSGVMMGSLGLLALLRRRRG